jgi:hypothetical protein
MEVAPMSRTVTPPVMTPQVTTPTTATHQPSHEEIARRAYDKWCQRGRPHGTQLQDWYEAESELKKEKAPMPMMTGGGNSSPMGKNNQRK